MNITVKKKTGLNFLIFLLVVAIIIVAIRFVVPGIIGGIASTKKDAFAKDKNTYVSYDGSNASVEKYYSELDSQTSDIKDYSKADKLTSGLSIEDGSDTDNDGLTDKEEIEVYHTDPLKKSTANDLYTDKEKVDMGKDPLKAIKDGREGKLINNSNTEISLTPDTVDKEYATIDNITGVFENIYSSDTTVYPWAGKYTIYRDYIISGYTGSMDIHIDNILSENEGLKAEDIAVLVSYDTDFNKVKEEKTSINGSDIRAELSGEDTHLVVIANKDKKGSFAEMADNLAIAVTNPKKMIANSLIDDLEDSEKSYNTGFESVTIGLPITDVFLTSPTTFFVSSDLEESDKIMLEKVGRSAVAFSNKPVKKYKQLTRKRFTLLTSILNKIPSRHIVPSNDKKDVIGPYYYYYSDVKDFTISGDMLHKEQEEAAENAKNTEIDTTPEVDVSNPNAPVQVKAEQNTNFLTNNIFPFGNFQTNFAKQGNCAGISYYTMLLYNQKTAPATGSFDISSLGLGSDMTDGGVAAYDISKNEENKTLLDPGLSDFRSADWMAEYQSGKKPIEPDSADDEFFKMIATYWGESNSRDASPYIYNSRLQSVSYATVKRMMKAIDNGKILQFCTKLTPTEHAESFYKEFTDSKNEHSYSKTHTNRAYTEEMERTTGLGCHAMNIYDYKQMRSQNADGTISIVTYFRVYDSNYPGNTETNYLICVSHSDEDTAYIDYIYMPSAKAYAATNMFTPDSNCYFQVTDEMNNNYVTYVNATDWAFPYR